jgi:hypothetical protein
MLDHQAEVMPFSMSNFQLLEHVGRQHHHGEAFPSQPPESGWTLVPPGVQEVTEIPKEGLCGVLQLGNIVNVKEIVGHGGRECGDDFFEGDCDCFHRVRSVEGWAGQGNERV